MSSASAKYGSAHFLGFTNYEWGETAIFSSTWFSKGYPGEFTPENWIHLKPRLDELKLPHYWPEKSLRLLHPFHLWMVSKRWKRRTLHVIGVMLPLWIQCSKKALVERVTNSIRLINQSSKSGGNETSRQSSSPHVISWRAFSQVPIRVYMNFDCT